MVDDTRAFNAAFVRQRADQLTRLHTVFMANGNTVAGHAFAGRAGALATSTARLARCAIARGTLFARCLKTTNRRFVGAGHGGKKRWIT